MGVSFSRLFEWVNREFGFDVWFGFVSGFFVWYSLSVLSIGVIVKVKSYLVFFFMGGSDKKCIYVGE